MFKHAKTIINIAWLIVIVTVQNDTQCQTMIDNVTENGKEYSVRQVKLEEKKIRDKYGQKANIFFYEDAGCQYSVGNINIKISDKQPQEDAAREFIKSYEIRNIDVNDLSFKKKWESKGKTVFRFEQYYKNIKVYRSSVSVEIHKDYITGYTSVLFDDININVKSHEYYKERFEKIVAGFVKTRGLSTEAHVEEIFGRELYILPPYLWNKNEYIVCWSCRIYDWNNNYFKHVYLDAENGEILIESPAMKKVSSIGVSLTGGGWNEDKNNEPLPVEPDVCSWPMSSPYRTMSVAVMVPCGNCEGIPEDKILTDMLKNTKYEIISRNITDSRGCFAIDNLPDNVTYHVAIIFENPFNKIWEIVNGNMLSRMIYYYRYFDNTDLKLDVNLCNEKRFGVSEFALTRSANLLSYMGSADNLNSFYFYPYKGDDDVWPEDKRMHGIWNSPFHASDGHRIYIDEYDPRASAIYHEYVHNSMFAYIEGRWLNELSASYPVDNTKKYMLHAEVRGIEEGIADMGSALFRHNPNQWGVGSVYYYHKQEKHPEPYRTLKNSLRLEDWPRHIDDDGYGIGEIFGGALWDLYEFIGEKKFSRLLWSTLKRLADEEKFVNKGLSDFLFAMLLEDDDDGNLANGTPNCYFIYTAFEVNHGIEILQHCRPDFGCVPQKECGAGSSSMFYTKSAYNEGGYSVIMHDNSRMQ